MYYDPAATGERIQNLRKDREVTQEQLAIDLNISDRYMRNSFQGAKGVRVRRADPKQKIKDVCTYCQIRYGFDYYVQPDKNAGQYVKRGHFDDESECA